jgi:hypothetical protein
MRFIRETEQIISSGRGTPAISTWYQQCHYEAFKADCQKTIGIIAQDHQHHLDDDEGCLRNNLTDARNDISTRGLEHYVDEERAALQRERRLAAWDLVLDEQMNQDESGDYQPQHIAEAYQEVSVRSQIEAHVKALQYRKEYEA